MDPSGWFNLTNAVLVIVILLLCIYYYGMRNYKIFKNLGIPGPKPQMFVGNIGEFKEGLHVAFDKMRKQYGDYFGCFLGSVPTLVICDPEIIGEIIVKRFTNFTNRPIMGTIDNITACMMSLTKDAHWKFLRTTFAPVNSTKKLRENTALLEKEVKSFIRNIGKISGTGQAHDIRNIFVSYSIDCLASTGFGVDTNAQEDPNSEFTINARQVFESLKFLIVQGYLAIFPFLFKIITVVKPELLLGDLAPFLPFWKQRLAEQKKTKGSNNGKNVFEIAVNAQVEGSEKTDWNRDSKLKDLTEWKEKRGITDDEILAACLVFVLIGQHTTGTTLALFTYSIAQDQDIQQKLVDEIERELGQDPPDYDNIQKLTYLDMCFSETVRKYPVATLMSREAKNDCVIKGIKIPAGMGITVPITAVHNNPHFWPDPDKFDPERFTEENKAKQEPFSYVPFGTGARTCFGMRVSQQQIKMAAVEMLRNFRLFPCEKRNGIKLATGVFGLFIVPEGIWVRFEPR